MQSNATQCMHVCVYMYICDNTVSGIHSIKHVYTDTSIHSISQTDWGLLPMPSWRLAASVLWTTAARQLVTGCNERWAHRPVKDLCSGAGVEKITFFLKVHHEMLSCWLVQLGSVVWSRSLMTSHSSFSPRLWMMITCIGESPWTSMNNKDQKCRGSPQTI